MLIIWLPINDALEKYKQYRYLISALNYITPFNPVSERAVKQHFNILNDIEIFVQTPNVGDIWSTHPSYRYVTSLNQFYGQKLIFCKVSDEKNVLRELVNLKMMKRNISVPTPITMIEHKNDISDLKEMKPNSHIAAILVEEFIDSISIGRALIEERIDIEILIKETINILLKMHTFCTHRDLKQSHIRICLDPEDCKSLTFGFKIENELIIKNVSIIDVETAKMNYELSEKIESGTTNDIKQLIVSLTGYLSSLEHPTGFLVKILPMSLEKKLKRFGMLLDAISEEYIIPPPNIRISNSKTLEFLLEFLDKSQRK